MFKNYHILIFKDRDQGVWNLRLRGWLSFLFVLLFIALTGVNVFLWKYYNQSVALETALAESSRSLQGQDSQLLGLANRLEEAQQDLRRIQIFDAKLRVLMNIGLDQEQERPAVQVAQGRNNKKSQDAQANETESNQAPAQDAGDADLEQPMDSNEHALLDTAVLFSRPEMLSQHRELFSRQMNSLIDDLTVGMALEESSQQLLLDSIHSKKDLLIATPSIWPTDGYLSSGFGYRRSPFTGRSTLHAGLDIANRPGTNILAPAGGTVTFSGNDGAYGICVMIDHGNNIVTRYAHLRRSLVTVNQYVSRGDVVAHMGSSGRSTGPHLHYEVRVNGVPVNPMRYILN